MFTENQVRQFYVATKTAADIIAPQQVDNSHSATDLNAKSDGACQFIISPDGNEMYLMYKGPKDAEQRSDLIKKCNVVDVRLTAAADLVHKNKKAVITLDPNLLSSTNLAISGDYVLNVNIHNYVALDYNTTKIKFGAARGIAGTAASDLYKKLATNLAKNFKREPAALVKIGISTAATGASPKWYGEDWSSTTAAAIVIEEVEQPWRRGAAPQEFVNFSVDPSTVYDSTNNIDVIWGKVQYYGSATYTDGTASAATVAAGGTQVNSKKVADMEWFFHKERGDRYGEAGFPYNIDTVYQVEPDYTYGYDFIDIHYYFEGNCHNVGKSEKTLTIAVPAISGAAPEANAQKLLGVATSGSETGLYLFLKGTGTPIRTSASWDATT